MGRSQPFISSVLNKGNWRSKQTICVHSEKGHQNDCYHQCCNLKLRISMCQRSNLNNNLQWWWRYQQRLQFLSLNSFKEVFQNKIHDMHWKSIAAKKAMSVNANKFLCKMEREKGWMSFTFWCAFSPSTPKLSIILTIVKCAFLVCLRFQNAIESNSMLGMRPKRQHSKSVHCANTFFIFF